MGTNATVANFPSHKVTLVNRRFLLCRTMELGPFAGPIHTIILIVDCLFFLFLEWWMPREDLDYVTHELRQEAFRQVQPFNDLPNVCLLVFSI